MRPATCLILICLLQISTAVYSQTTKFNFTAKNKQIVEVLKEIEESSRFRFFYIREQVNVERMVTVKAKNATVEDILNTMCSPCDALSNSD